MKNWSMVLLSTALLLIFLTLLPLPKALINSALTDARIEPRFGLTGADVTALEIAIGDLEKSVSDVAEIYDENPAEKKAIKSSLHPIGFLKSIAKLEARRRAFIEYPSLENFLGYLWQMKRATALYERSLRKYQDTLKNLPNANENETYHFGTNAVSLKTLLGNVDFMLKNAALLKKYSQNNSILPRGKAGQLPSYISSVEELSSQEQKDAKFTKKLIERLGWEIVMPLVEVLSDCGEPQERDLFYLVRREGFLVPMSIRPVYFHFEISRFKNAQFYLPLREAGFEYAWQPDFNYYFCPDLSYQAEILTLYRIRELLEDWKENKGAGEFTEFEKAADEFLSADPLWRPIQLLLFEAAGKNDTPLSEEIRRLEIEKSGYFEELVRFGARLNYNYPGFTRRLKKPLEIKELFITRSYPSLYFLPWNRSIWIADTPLDFSDYFGETEFYVSYRELLKIYPEEKILELSR